MKKIITSFLVLAAVTVTAQTKVVDHAVITTKTTIVSPEGADDMPAPPAGPDGAEVRVMRFGGDGETKSLTTIKGDLVKTFIETDMSRTTVIRDNGKKITTTLMEIMGNKNGFYATDEEQEQMGKRMDSMMQSRRQGQADNNPFANNAITGTEIIYAEGSKKIAGLACKKAYVVNSRKNGTRDSSEVWYCPDFKIQGLASTGGTSSFGSFGRVTGLGGLNTLNGFPMQYETKMNRGRKMIVEVTKINIEKEVTDKEFEIPKDFVIKPMKDLQNGMGGGMQFRMGGPGQ
jgi:hypothetical protein